MKGPELVVALDLPGREDALRIARSLRGHADMLKVGPELFLGTGPGLLHELAGLGWRVFLDLKFHDIPAAVAGGVRAAGGLGVDLATVHVAGGPQMLAAAVEARAVHGRPRLLGVTLLTSLAAADLEELGMGGDPAAVVERMAGLAAAGGLDGVVTSAREVAAVKRRHGEGFLAAVPGIRPAGVGEDDQARVGSVAAAVSGGADYLVVGRPVLQAADPVQAASALRAEMERFRVRG